MLKENNNLKIIAGLMLCSTCLAPFILKNHTTHADVNHRQAIRTMPKSHQNNSAQKQQIVLSLQQRINQYQHNNQVSQVQNTKIPNFTSTKANNNKNVLPLSNRIMNNRKQFSTSKNLNKQHQTNKHISHVNNKESIKHNTHKQVYKNYQINKHINNHVTNRIAPTLRLKRNIRMTRATQPPQNPNNIQMYHDLSKSVLRYRPYLNSVCRKYHMRNYEVLMLAIMETESHGNGKDIMQSSASLGKKPNSLTPRQSIKQAVKYMHSLINHAQQMDRAEHQNRHIKPWNYHNYATDSGLLAQAYNFGGEFLNYVGNQKQGFNINISRNYSRNVIAPMLGNKKHKTYRYDNDLAKFYHTPYLYKSGGNYLYGMMVDQYISDGTPVQPILHTLSQYTNTHYIYGGKAPKDGFDSSGLIAYGYNKTFHIRLPKTTYAQWRKTKHVRGGINGARPGDLIFFKGTYGNHNHLSHVEFIVNRHLMLGITKSGIGFHYINNPYWMHHYAGVRRISQYHQINLQTERKLNRQARQYSQMKM